MTSAELTRNLIKIKNTEGVQAAKDFALTEGYAIRWDRQGNLYIRDLLV